MASDNGDVRKLSTLLEVSQTLGSTLDLRTSLARVLEILEEGHGTVSGAVTSLDDESGELRIEAATGITWQARRRASYKVGEGVTGQVVQSGQARGRAPREPRAPLPGPHGRLAGERQGRAELRMRARACGRKARGEPGRHAALRPRARLRPRGGVPGRGGVDDRTGGAGARTRGDGAPAPALREQRAPPGAQGALRVPQHHRQQPRDAARVRGGGPGSRDPDDGDDPGRVRAPARSSWPTRSTTTRPGPRSRS